MRALLVNTSFNVRGEPILCTPEDAFGCFMGSEFDPVVMATASFEKPSKKQASSRTTALHSISIKLFK